MDEREWMEFRSKVRQEAHNKIKTLIEEWCEECGVTSPIGYEDLPYEGPTHRVLTIYTDRPGVLIGRGGESVYKFQNKLKEAYNREYRVKFVEIRGGFVNIR